jgi:hypothetical protein
MPRQPVQFFDPSGFTGGSLERPAAKRLMGDLKQSLPFSFLSCLSQQFTCPKN